MKRFCIVLTAAVLVNLLFSDCFAQREIEFIPAIGVSETYDDNIFRDPTNEQSDYITSVRLPLTLNVLSEYTRLSVNFTPSYNWYSEFSENNYWRWLGSVSWDQRLTQYLRLQVSDTYVNSRDPIDDFSDLNADRTQLNKYWVNRGNVSLSYTFGPENLLQAGYYRRDRENSDPTYNDSNDQRPFANLTYWFDVRNGIRLDYTYADVALSVDPDFTGHAPGVRYLRRFSPQTVGHVGYVYTTRDFDEGEEDYVVHNGYVGLDHAFSPEYTISANAGYYVQIPDISDNTDGVSLNVDLTRNFERGNITIGLGTGWDDDYLISGNPNFEQFYGGFVTGRYQILENLSVYGGASYRQTKDKNDFQDNNLRANIGLSWVFMRWFSLSLDYQYIDRNSDFDPDDFTVNRVMLTLRASKPEKWEWK